MAKLYFMHGTMGAGKSQALIGVATNYQVQEKDFLIIYPDTDTRTEKGYVSSRLGGVMQATPVATTEDIDNAIVDKRKMSTDLKAILVDEAQFLSKELVTHLKAITEAQGIPVLAYGLLKDFQGNLFEGSKALIEQAETIQEIKTECKYCGHKATYNVRLVNGKKVTEGEQVQVGSEEYEAVCFRHYHFHPSLIK